VGLLVIRRCEQRDSREHVGDCDAARSSLVIGRDAAGEVFALRDVCPHRAFPLSAGSCDGQTVECTYHGWRFDGIPDNARRFLRLRRTPSSSVTASMPAVFRVRSATATYGYTSRIRGSANRPLCKSARSRVAEIHRSIRIAHLTADLTCSMDTGILA